MSSRRGWLVLLLVAGCSRALQALDDSPDELGNKLRSVWVNTRRDAAITLANLATHRPESAESQRPALRGALHDRDVITRIFVANALASLGDADDELTDVFRAAATHPNAWVRVQACCGVRANPRLLARSVLLLGDALNDADSAVVSEAAFSLSKCETIASRSLLDRLLRLARESDHCPKDQESALLAIGKADPAHAAVMLDQLRTFLPYQDRDFDLRPVKERVMTSLLRSAELAETR